MLTLTPLHFSSWSINIKIAVQMAGQCYYGCEGLYIRFTWLYLVFCFFGVCYWIRVRVGVRATIRARVKIRVRVRIRIRVKIKVRISVSTPL